MRRMSALEVVANARSSALHCFRCGKAYGQAQWQALPLVKRLEARDLASLVDPWPENLTVEVRACAACGRGLSRVGTKA